MKPLIVAVCLLALAQAGPINVEQEDLQGDCAGSVDGLYPDVRRGCKRYYSCKRGVKVTHSCTGRDEVFNRNIYACVPASTYSCPATEKRELDEQRGSGAPDFMNFDCQGREDGFYADLLRRCHQYYMCKGGEKLTYFCQDHRTIFNAQMRACVLPSSYTCPSIKKRILEEVRREHLDRPDSLNFNCVNKTDGYYADKARGCHVFYYCLDEEKHQFNCVQGTLFDETTNVCNWASNVQCQPLGGDSDAAKRGVKEVGYDDGAKGKAIKIMDDSEFLKKLRVLLTELRKKKNRE